MRLIDKIRNGPNCSYNNRNRWADYIEFLCLDDKDHFVAKDDILNVIFHYDTDAIRRGEATHSQVFDNRMAQVDSYFEMIDFRNDSLLEDYPFEMEEGCITLKSEINELNVQYIFLLLCSSIVFFDAACMHRLTTLFEEYCMYIMQCLVPIDAKTCLFGTSRSDSLFRGNLRSRIEKLADFVGAQTTKSFDEDRQFDAAGGDEGLDLVSFLKLDKASHIPLALGQCTCSYDNWEVKQETVNQDTWDRKLEGIAPFWRFMFVPFYCRLANGKFEKATTISTCLIDRHRLLHIAQSHREISDEVKKLYLEKAMKEIWD